MRSLFLPVLGSCKGLSCVNKKLTRIFHLHAIRRHQGNNDRIGKHLGVPDCEDPDVKVLAKVTRPEQLARQIDKANATDR